MISMEEVKSSLNSNTFLTQDLKENIWQLVVKFNSKFPNISLSVLNEKIKDLQIIKGSKFLIRNASKYNVVENTIYINKSKSDEVDYQFILMRELLNIITVNGNYSGFNIDNKYESLNIGYTEKLAMLLVGNEEACEYEEEVSAIGMLEVIVGEGNIFQAYFSNDIKKILSVIG